MSTLLRLLGMALVGGGIVLAILGLRAQDSNASMFTRLVSGSPTKESVMLLAGGGAAILAGMTLVIMPGVAQTARRR